MNGKTDTLSESALQFFGTMTASISHEINNVLAIINENAGLLEDFTLMADKGLPIDPKRLKTLAEKIMTQIRRADTIIKKMNEFAHSVDVPVKRIDLIDSLKLLVALSKRFASIRGVTLELEHPADSIIITTNDFLLENLLWRCLDFAMDATGEDKTVVMHIDKAGNSAVIRFSGIEETPESIFHITKKDGLLSVIKGKLDFDPEAGNIVLTLPSDINS